MKPQTVREHAADAAHVVLRSAGKTRNPELSREVTDAVIDALVSDAQDRVLEKLYENLKRESWVTASLSKRHKFRAAFEDALR